MPTGQHDELRRRLYLANRTPEERAADRQAKIGGAVLIAIIVALITILPLVL